MNQKFLLVAAALVILWLNLSLWFGDSGHFARERLQGQLDEQRQRVAEIQSRNVLLTAEVLALKDDERNLEARARRDLGMIKKGEVFYLLPAAD